ncbi:hypothetical protein EXIGLDRAFT_706990 [Exidia glandulosa HHB12029]|uniref:Uncharacterized protein n=1 Tax=Exidia glandulosa HHB12029 TaxID=1314781 RepID=A0A165K0G7_EXIGL|nr:hypothetical protein EXIGLDRAFT_706990 [Exidia glandulosa HHB12029]
MQYSNGWVAFRAAFNVIVAASEWAQATRSQDIISTATSPRWKAAKDSGAGKLWRDYAKLSMEICSPNKNSRAQKRNREMEKKKALTSPPVLQTSPAPAANISLDTPSREPSSGKAPRTLSHPRHTSRAIAQSRPVVAPSNPLQVAPRLSAPRFDFSGFVSPQSAFTNGWSPYGPSHPLFPFPAQCIDASSANYVMPVTYSVPISTPCVAPLSMPTPQIALQGPPPSGQAFSPLAFTDFSSGPNFAASQLPAAGETVRVQGSPSFLSPFVVVPSLPAGSSGAVAQAPSISSSSAPAYHPTPPLPAFSSGRLQEPTLPQLSAASELELLPQETFIENLLDSASTQTTSGKTSFTALPTAEEEWDFLLPPTDWNAQALPQSPNANLLGLFDLDLAAAATANP